MKKFEFARSAPDGGLHVTVVSGDFVMFLTHEGAYSVQVEINPNGDTRRVAIIPIQNLHYIRELPDES